MSEVLADPAFPLVDLALILALLAAATYGVITWRDNRRHTFVLDEDGSIVADLPYAPEDVVIGVDIAPGGREVVVIGLKQPDGSLELLMAKDRTVDDE